MPQPETIKKTSEQIARFKRYAEIRERLRPLLQPMEQEFLDREKMRKRRKRTLVRMERDS